MRIWCCFGFTGEEDEEERYNRISLAMENDGGNVNEVDGGGGVLPIADEATRLVLGVDRRGGGSAVRDLEDMEMLFAMSVGGGAPPEMRSWNSFVRFSRRDEGEGSSGSALGSGMEDIEHDLHYKRAKVYSEDQESHFGMTTTSDAGNCSSSAERGYSYSQHSSLLPSSGILYHTFMLNNGLEESPFNTGTAKDEADESESSEAEDLVQMDLTDDLLHMVLSFLDNIDLCRAAMVCKQWRVASTHEDFWRCLNFENKNISLDQFADMCRRYPNATEVNIYGALPPINLLAMIAVSSLRNLESLTVGKGQLEDSFFHALEDCNMLRSLNVKDATLGSSNSPEIHINHEGLRNIKLTKCRVMRLAIRCPQLLTLSLKRSNMALAVLSCPILRLLDIGSCHKLSDAAIRSAATSCQQLESLDMSNCSCVSDETLREIAITCANLHVLNASYCPNISLEAVRLPMLTVLKLHSCEGITSASMSAISHSYLLEVLELDNCNLLTSVSLDLARLQSIRLVHCRKFADLYLQSAMLSYINVYNCAALRRINITSNALKKIALQKQENLTMLALQCQSLQEVDLTDCESLTDSICDVFSDGGGCPMLKSLVLDNCESLIAVRFQSTSLVSLSLVGCRAITSLELNCPCLENVSLDGCDHLESASFCPVALSTLNLGICPKLNFLSIEAPYMVSLELKGCGVLSKASIDCPLLRSLDASFCSQLKDDCLSATTASCPLIESLILMSCPSIGPDGLYSLRNLANLTVLDLSYTFLMDLQPVFESCQQLKVLKLQACKYLTNSSLEPLYNQRALPALEELDLSYGTLCQTAIEELLACCAHLIHLRLNGCINMHDLDWGSTGGQLVKPLGLCKSSGMFLDGKMLEPIGLANRLLETLNCVGCPNIRKVVIPPAAGCYHLSTLNLSLSANLKEVDIACYNLVFLNLSNCCSLEVLKLGCPKLTSLFLQSCNMDEEVVESAISQCTLLETLDVRTCPKISAASMIKFRMVCPSLKRIYYQPSPSG